jgi:hypothetical protein
MSITNTSKENLKDEHSKHHQRKLGGVCYAHLLSFPWWCLLCPSFKFFVFANHNFVEVIYISLVNVKCIFSTIDLDLFHR